MRYGLNMKCLSQDYVLNARSPTGSAVLGGSGNRKWGQARGTKSLGDTCLLSVSCPGPHSVSLLPVHHEVKKIFCHKLPPPGCSGQAHGTK
jgi:hypothetical protein